MSPSTLNTVVTTASLFERQVLRLLIKLEALLPYTIPLTRRIQFHVKKPKETSKVILSLAISPDEASGGISEEIGVHDRINAWLETRTTHQSATSVTELPWIACHVDLSSPGTTQAWLFGSWEIPSQSQRSQNQLHAELLRTLLHHIHTTMVPSMPLDPPATWLKLRDTGKWLSQPYSRSKVLFGTLHEGIRALMQDHWVARIDARYEKWVFEPSVLGTGDAARNDPLTEKAEQRLPEGYIIGTLDDDELQTILDGTQIPRTLAYLKEVVNAGLYHRDATNNGTHIDTRDTEDTEGAEDAVTTPQGKGDLIAYAFLGKDGSLGGLDVSPAHRGKGLAVHLARELFRREAEGFSYSDHININDGEVSGSDEEAEAKEWREGLGREGREGYYHHADVGEDNVASQAVMRKVGGDRMWRVCWAEIDVDVVVGVKRRAMAEVGQGRDEYKGQGQVL